VPRLTASLPSAGPRARLAPLLAALLTACAGRLPAPVARPTVPTLPPPPSVEDAEALRERRLRVPVAGVRASAIPNTFADARGGDRMHLAVDLLAPRGTPVLSADDGRLWKLRSNSLGGITVYATDPEERFVYYYAHLDRYRDGLVEGMPLQRGDTLGFVGTTGNAPPDVPHLHFQVARLGADHRWWTGTPIDPLPYLREAAGEPVRAVAARGTPAHTPTHSSARTTAPAAPPRPTVPRPTVPALAADSSAATDSVLVAPAPPRAAAPRARRQ
jgi:murein DD-endopeptidase MepM/ murein hydrolase activator NlpD